MVASSGLESGEIMALTLQQRVSRAGLILGPVLALALHFALPETFTDAQGNT